MKKVCKWVLVDKIFRVLSSLVRVLVSKRQAQAKKSEKKSFKQLKECEDEVKASSSDDGVV